MKADEARNRSLNATNSIEVEKYMVELYKSVAQAADKGSTSIRSPFQIFHNPEIQLKYPTVQMIELICKRLTRDGYKVVDLPDEDPGHPCSGPYTKISWK